MVHEVVVVGGGIVGAATAWELTQRGLGPVLLLEKEDLLGQHQTGHNSGVVHSGIYYEPGSLKAVLCKEGAEATEAFTAQNGLPFERTGKLLVATNPMEVGRLTDLVTRAGLNGIRADFLDSADLRRREPMVSGLSALHIPSTAITDYVAIARKLAELTVSAGGQVRSSTTVLGLQEREDAVELETTSGSVSARHVIFCAGLQADRLARMSGLADDVQIVPFRGEYYEVVPGMRQLVSTLVYPVPDPALPFLGVHLTPTIGGQLHVGPNAVLGLSREGYRKGSFNWLDAKQLATFSGTWNVARQHVRVGAREVRNSLWKRGYLRECRKYTPSLRSRDLVPREAGIRAQAVMQDGTLVHDFLMRSTRRTLHVLNAPSPAATSAMPIARHVVDRLFDGA